MNVFPTQPYLKRARRLFSDNERYIAESAVASAPDYWPVIAGTGGARKARVALAGRGKRGGARLIYYWRSHAGEIFLLTVYAKNDKEDLSHDDKKKLRDLIAAIEDADG